MTSETAMWGLGALVVPVVLWLLTNMRRSLDNFGQRLGALERDVAVLAALIDRQREHPRRHTRAVETPPDDDDDAQ